MMWELIVSSGFLGWRRIPVLVATLGLLGVLVKSTTDLWIRIFKAGLNKAKFF